MKRLTLLLLAGALLALILQPVSVTVNTQFNTNTPRADGVVVPFPPPSGDMLLADGVPMPPFPPPPGGGMLLADGVPMPPFPPPPGGGMLA